MQNKVYDLLIIGGGVNGCGIAADAAGRGLSVYLCEKDDLASHTSSASTKMIHGGLRYLEYYDFRLVREALIERDVLLNVAPHIIHPLHLVIPHNNLQRPKWLIQLGLFIYDHLGWRFGKKSKLPRSKRIKLGEDSLEGSPLKSELNAGFVYSDCTVDDARLVVLNALSAKEHGASINTRTEFLSAQRVNNMWQAQVKNQHSTQTIQAKVLINAAGPWVSKIINDKLHIATEHHVELVKGSHIVFPKFYAGNQAYLLQNPDKRVVFVIPYHNHFTMVGTTDVAYHDDPNKVEIDEQEKNYLCNTVNRYFKKNFSPFEIINSWSGVRPLQAQNSKNPAAVTRDYSLEIHDADGSAPVLSVFGGKITTYRRLAEHTLKLLRRYFPKLPRAWTAAKPLPGGDLPQADIAAFIRQQQHYYPELPGPLLKRWALLYGTRMDTFLKGVQYPEQLGEKFTANLYQKEVDYLIEQEWARTAEDILWRRTKEGLFATPAEVQHLSTYLDSKQL